MKKTIKQTLNARYCSLGVFALFGSLCALACDVQAQAPGVPIESSVPLEEDKVILQRVHALRKQGKLLNKAKADALFAKPQAAAISLPAPLKEPLPAREIYRRARAAFVRIAWMCEMRNDQPGYLESAGGYAIAEGGVVATAAHVLEMPEEIAEVVKEAHLVAITADGIALPVTSILAVDVEMDAAIVRVPDFKGAPLPLNANVTPGDAAFCFSDPIGERGFFSAGSINRFWWETAKAGDLQSVRGVRSLRLDVSTPWAPGSSGAAVLDSAGNAIGHVFSLLEVTGSDIAPAAEPAAPRGGEDDTEADPDSEDEWTDDATIFEIHTAIPARGVRLLAESMEKSSAKPRKNKKRKR